MENVRILYGGKFLKSMVNFSGVISFQGGGLLQKVVNLSGVVNKIEIQQNILFEIVTILQKITVLNMRGELTGVCLE